MSSSPCDLFAVGRFSASLADGGGVLLARAYPIRALPGQLPSILPGDVPGWLVVGVVLGAALSLLVAAAFVVGRRVVPPAAHSSGGFGGEERRRREIATYLQAIGESYRERATVHETTVEFYLPDRDVAITFDPRVYFGLADADVHVVLSEHELPGASLGSRLPFSTPDFGRTASRDSDPTRRSKQSRRSDDSGRHPSVERADRSRHVRAAFAALGLRDDADAEAVRTAYRRRIKEVHPDQGGDERQFRRVREAYEVATEHAHSASETS